MKITKVSFDRKDPNCKSLANCSIVFDDCLKLKDIRLFKNENGFYLVLPSKQDVYQEVQSLNQDVNLCTTNISKTARTFDEFYHPVTSELYKIMLETIVNCYIKSKQENCYIFRF